jgi:hypothetical protein
MRKKTNKKFDDKENKINFAVIISVSSLLLALISFGFSIYKYNIDIKYKEFGKENVEFEQVFKKIEMLEKSIEEQTENCEGPINKDVLDENLRLLREARTALVNNNNEQALSLLKQIGVVCEGYEPWIGDNTLIWEISIFAVIWVVMIASLFLILKRK